MFSGSDENWKTKGNFSRYDADPVHINGVFNRTTYEQNLKDVQFLFKNKGNTMALIGLVLLLNEMSPCHCYFIADEIVKSL